MVERLLPTHRAKTPFVSRLESRKVVLRHRCREIVALRFREFKKVIGHDRADRVDAVVIAARFAAAVAVPTRHRTGATRSDWFAENIRLILHACLRL